MELNGTLVAILGLMVFVLAWLVKKYGWDIKGKPMLWAVVGLSLLGGVVQVLISAQSTPFPPMPADPAGIVFTWVPNLVAWVAKSGAAVFAASQLIYSIVMKGLAPDA